MRSTILNLSLLINPILSVLTAIFLKIDLKKHYIFIAIFFGYIAMLLEPSLALMGEKSPDILRHYERFMEYDLNLSPFEYIVINNQKDLFITLEYYFGNLFGIKKEFMPFISTFISYYFIFKIFDILFKNSTKKNINLLFLAVFFIISFKGAALSLRNLPAIYIATYGLFVYFYEKNLLKTFIFLLLANCLHIMTALISLVFIIFLCFRKIIKFKYLSVLFYFSLVMLFIPNISNILFEIVGKFLPFNISSYTEGQWAGEYLEEKNLKGLIYHYFPMYLKILFMAFTAIYLKNKIESKQIFKFYIVFFFVLSLMHNFDVMFERFIAFEFILSIVLWLIYFKEQNQIQTNLIRFILIVSSLIFIFDFYVMRFMLPETLPKLFYPTIYNLIFDSIPYEKFL